MTYANEDALISPEWLRAHLDDPGLRIVDATAFLPGSERDAYEEYTYRHIPGAVYFDIDDISDGDTLLPHMLPGPDKFARAVGALGIGNDHRVVVYDCNGGYSAAARVWWMFRVFGHDRVSVLDGGLPGWTRSRNPVVPGEETLTPCTFTARMNPDLVRDLDDMMANLETRREQVVDARNAKRFAGIEPEPRPNRRNGHIPGAVNVPFFDLMVPRRNFSFRPADEMIEVFAKAGIDLGEPIVVTCGSGVTTGVVALALHLLGHEDAAVYDGSWAEWGNHEHAPVET